MIPKKTKELIKPTANSLEVSESLVETVTSFYWSSVRRALSNIESPSIMLHNLGTFRVRYKCIPIIEKKYKQYLEKVERENITSNQLKAQTIANNKLANLEKARIELDENFKRKYEIKGKRLANYNKNLEE